MLDKFWESIGTNLASRWLDYVFGPAFLFWAGGLALYAWQTGWQQFLATARGLTQFQHIGWIILGLLVLVFSSLLAQAIRFPVLRLLEGYWWPFTFLGRGRIAMQQRRLSEKNQELRQLKALEEQTPLNADQRQRQAALEDWVHWYPVDSSDLLPTALGNALRARERTPGRKYGLDAVICWPCLWPLLPEVMRTDVSHARASLDRMVEIWIWGLLFLIWMIWTPWAALISLAWMYISYGMALQAAMAYGDLLETAFDLHRLSLYDAIGWQRPPSIQEEKEQGAHLTEFLWRGTA